MSCRVKEEAIIFEKTYVEADISNAGCEKLHFVIEYIYKVKFSHVLMSVELGGRKCLIAITSFGNC